MAWPCDRHLSDADDALYRAIDVDAPPAVTFRWLCQLRVAPYSYDWIDNLGRASPRTLTAGLEKLAVGQPVMTIFELVDFEADRHLTFRLRRGRAVFGDVAVTYLVVPRARERSRIAVKMLVRYPALRPLAGRLFPLGDLVMMRKQLRALEQLGDEGDLRQPLVERRLRRLGGGLEGRAHRVPASASFSISAALDFSTKPGPVSTNWPPPTVLRLVLLSVRKTTGR